MHRCTQSAAGGTIQRLKPGFATVCSRSRNDNNAIVFFLLPLDPYFLAPSAAGRVRSANRKLRARLSIKQANAILLLQMAIVIAVGSGRGLQAAGSNPRGARARASSSKEAIAGWTGNLSETTSPMVWKTSGSTI